MAAHARLKNEFTEDGKYHNLTTWLIMFQQYCSQNHGSHLVFIETSNENTFLKTYVKQLTGKTLITVGTIVKFNRDMRKRITTSNQNKKICVFQVSGFPTLSRHGAPTLNILLSKLSKKWFYYQMHY